MDRHYRLGPKLPGTAGNMWDIIRGYVSARPGIGHSELMASMMARKLSDWPPRVLRDPSIQGIGSEKWCNGYLKGAVRLGYLIRD